ncbi:phenylalanine--tRNA ligase subunit alpha [Candidatus Xenohaliotis californiensis]|uniref:Phenylalanine--tRNA ligase alpha subunit n=1 Tax=Candidatus Xenohaliotis californiensis TaxID=84677 RepID=A0ABP0EXN8_9RICK|nr:phenylalanine--tRNA ligase subunit alpha [Candidatus Xenohaliotis californiensis]
MFNFDTLHTKFHNDLQKVRNIKDCELLRIKYLGKSALLTAQLHDLRNLPVEERSIVGMKLNNLKNEFNTALKNVLSSMKTIEQQDEEDYYLPIREEYSGSVHVLSKVASEIYDILSGMGFAFSTGPEIEDEHYNFTLLNTPQNHPARQMQDSFYFNKYSNNGRLMLRTQTSSVQIRTMKNSKPPYMMFSIGRVYRRDWDATHTPMFTQIEGLCIDKEINFSNMQWYISMFLKKFFNSNKLKFRFRPSFFPFVDPGSEVDVLYRKSNDCFELSNVGDKWLEIMGCGMVHENVLSSVDLSEKDHQGFAFGIGLERLAMLKYGINDLRRFFNPDIRWMKKAGFAPFC